MLYCAGTVFRPHMRMRAEFLPFCRPSIGEAEIAAVTGVLRSGWLTTGPKTAAFERRFAERVNASGATAVGSGTAGMQLMLRALDIGPGAEVITPSLTWVSTPNVIVLAGAKPVFVDVDRDTLLVTPQAIEAAITPRTKLVVPVHFAGAPADMGPIRSLAAEKGIAVVEDAAHALGTMYRDEPVGSRGTAVFSFHPIKNITTGEGGMICTRDAALRARLHRLRFHGLAADAHERDTQGRAPQAEVMEPGYKCNMTDIAAALGLVQLERLKAFNRQRARLAAHYLERLAGIDEVRPLGRPPYPHEHAWHLFVVRLDVDKAGISRDHFMAELKARNIGSGLHFKAVHLQRYYTEHLGMQRGMLPHTEWNSDRLCSLPLFPDMTVEDADEVVAAIKDVLASS